MFSFIQKIETDIGLISVDINVVVGKLVSAVEVTAHEFDALLNWAVAQAPVIQADLTAATPIISAVTGLLLTASTGNPALGAAASAAVTGINEAVNTAETAVKALNAANAALQTSKAAGNGAVVNDTQAVLAGVQAITGATAAVANVKTVSLAAAAAIQAAVNPPPAP
jgi:hypothetical protein